MATEAEVKSAVADYLQIGENQGRWYADRLNSGEIIAVAGDQRRRIKLCRPGTADFFVIKGLVFELGVRRMTVALLYFIEIKGTGTQFTPEQQEFAEAVQSQGAQYYLVESIDELEKVLG